MNMEQSLSTENFKYFIDFLQQKSGIALQEGQLYLIQNRLIPILATHNLPSLNHLVERLKTNNQAFHRLVVESLTTHESSFFRDAKPFDYFANTLLPQIAEKKDSRSVYVWSAACSSGQEPYSLAMLIIEFLNKNDPGSLPAVNIIATDLSQAILDKAKKGIFSHFEVQRGLPTPYLIKYFKKDGLEWAISDEIKQLVRFQAHNLIQPHTLTSQRFDVIFCRNVLIYFDEATKHKVVQYLCDNLETNGMLVLGGSEILSDFGKVFTPVREVPGMYQKKE